MAEAEEREEHLEKERGRKKVVKKEKNNKLVLVSGGFDPLHAGHVAMFDTAKHFGGYLMVVVNSDEWLKKKKGYLLMNEIQRDFIVKSIRFVNYTVISHHCSFDKDMSVASEIESIKPDVFLNSGDRIDNIPEIEIEACEKVGAEVIFSDIPCWEYLSSSKMIEKAAMELEKIRNGETKRNIRNE